MLRYKLLLITLLGILLSGCQKEGCMNPYAVNYDPDATREDCSCIAYVDAMEGTFEIRVDAYPADTAIEGITYRVPVYRFHQGCDSHRYEDFNYIRFRNLFRLSYCFTFPMDVREFTVSASDFAYWNGFPITGNGSIVDGTLTFEGLVSDTNGISSLQLQGTYLGPVRWPDDC